MATANSHSHNVEALTLLQSLNTLTTAVSGDLLRVANRLTEEELISLEQLEESRLQTKTSRVRANELVGRVIDTTNLHPEKFIVFLEILEESGLFRTVVKDVYKKYAQNQNRPPGEEVRHRHGPPEVNQTQLKGSRHASANLDQSGNQRVSSHICRLPLSPWVIVLLTMVLLLVGLLYFAAGNKANQIFTSTLVEMTIIYLVVGIACLLLVWSILSIVARFN